MQPRVGKERPCRKAAGGESFEVSRPHRELGHKQGCPCGEGDGGYPCQRPGPSGGEGKGKPGKRCGHGRGSCCGNMLPQHPGPPPVAQHREPPPGIGFQIHAGDRTDSGEPHRAGSQSHPRGPLDAFQVYLRHLPALPPLLPQVQPCNSPATAKNGPLRLCGQGAEGTFPCPHWKVAGVPGGAAAIIP